VSLTNLPPSCAVAMKSWNLKLLEPCGPLQAGNGTALPLHFNQFILLSQIQFLVTSYCFHYKVETAIDADVM
jgi:hypothetical protein